ncbi:YgjP-like metallopeptidase domain-containing protein [Cellulomonas sp. Root137]|uniref:YgjP-like metallopeptidase domain-containing protein n=1 Tax=Cellulomonas sp. Root137 TaxID=1736459 RepID=UPI000A6A955A
MQPTQDLSQVEIRRSRKRVRTVTAWREGDRTIVAIPARFTRAQEREWVRRMLTRLATQERRRRPSDDELMSRATELAAKYLGGRVQPTTVRWSTNQGRRWGSCTPSDGSIRISDRVRGMPRWVLDYVLLHELAHLLHAGHGPDFWAELDTYPRTLRARGFLEGYAYAAERGAQAAPGESDEDADRPTDEVDDGGIDEPEDVVSDEVDVDELNPDDEALGQLELDFDAPGASETR